MSLKIFHTSDLHLGMKFANYPEVQKELCEARFNTLKKLVKIGNEEQCHLFVIAGDLFDRVSVAKRDVLKAAQIIGDFQGHLITILPGNHDYISMGQSDLWSIFSENAGDNVMILEDNKVYDLEHFELDVNLYPAPCTSKHSHKNQIGWKKTEPKNAERKYHIGIAHGSLKGFSPDFDNKFYPMTESELLECGMDLWLMGHTHIQYPEHPGTLSKIFYPATPEPDGFDCTHEGKAWIIDLDENKKIHAQSKSVGTFRFLHDSIDINNVSALEKLKKKYSLSEFNNALVKLKLRGRLPKEEYQSIDEAKEVVRSHLFYLQWNDSEISPEITIDIINREFTEKSFPYQLLAELAERDDSEGLQIAYELIQEVKQ